MTQRMIERDRWADYFNTVSRTLGAQQVEIEVAGLDLGDQIETEWVPLEGLTYDRRDDALEVATPALTHRIVHPGKIAAEEGAGGLAALEVVDGDGTLHVIRLKAPLLLAD
jgi:hypothetical protein